MLLRKLKNIFGVGLFFCIYYIELYGVIKEIVNIQELFEKVTISPGTLVVWDIDNVIVLPDPRWIWDIAFLKKFNPFQRAAIFYHRKNNRAYQFVEPMFLSVFKAVHDAGGMSLGLTSRRDVDRQLLEFFLANDVSFTLKELLLSDPLLGLDVSYNAHFGIVFCNVHDKGKALRDFFEKTDCHPSSIVFIDDRVENCISVEKSCLQDPEIPCICLHYTYSPSYDGEIVQFQVKTLLGSRKFILTDQQACREYQQFSKVSQLRELFETSYPE